MATKVIEKVTRKNQKELLDKLGNPHTDIEPYKYCASYIETEDGKICAILKPLTLEKNFCFPENKNRSISEAVELVEKATHDQDYFISENVRRAGYEDEIEKIEKVEDGSMQAFFCDSIYCENGKNKVGIWFSDNCEIGEDGLPPHRFISPSSFRQVADEELQAYKQAILAANDALLKRLNTYLKRFGLSKVRAWAYRNEE